MALCCGFLCVYFDDQQGQHSNVNDNYALDIKCARFILFATRSGVCRSKVTTRFALFKEFASPRGPFYQQLTIWHHIIYIF